MEWFGHSNKSFDFNMFSDSHFVILAIFLLITSFIFLNRNKLKSEKWRKAEILAAISLIVIEITYHIWMIVNDIWTLSRSLPLELCNLSLILCVLLLLTRKKLIFEILFFTAVLGASRRFLHLHYPMIFRIFVFFISSILI